MATSLLLEAGVVFTILAIAGSLAWWVGQSVIPAYLVAGILVGPYGLEVAGVSLRLVERSEFIDLFAELGLVFLLFFIGVEFSLSRLLETPGRVLRAGGVDLVVNVGIGLGLGLAFGYSVAESLFIAAIIYPSSSAVITKSLIDLGWIADPESEPIMTVLIFEDVVMAIFLVVLTVIALGQAPAEALVSAGEAMLLLVLFALLAVYGSGLVERAFGIRSDELFLLRVVGLTALLAGLALTQGVSEAVAAFFIGGAVSESDLKARLEHLISPARDLFASVFFFAIGLSTNLAIISGAGLLLVVGILASIASKALTGYVGGRSYTLDRRRSIRVAMAMVTRGEFSLVVAALTVSYGAMTNSAVIQSFAVGYVLVMSILGTLLMRYSEEIAGFGLRRASG